MAWSLIGKNFTPPDIRGKVTGEAKFAEDFRAEGMVFARLLTSPMPHGRVLGIDAAEALEMDGVYGLLTADDDGVGNLLTNEPLYVGDPILAVAAIDETTAQNAIERINLEIEPLPFTCDPLQSLYPGGPDARGDGTNVGGPRNGIEPRRVKWTAADFAAVPEGRLPMGEAPWEWAFGDLEAEFANAALVFDETFVAAGNSTHSMEPRTAMAYWQNGKCYVHTGVQSHTAIIENLADALGVGVDEVVLINEYCGGGFGSKSSASAMAGIAGHLSKQINRPVMLRVSRHEEFFIGSARGALQGRVRIGFRADGRVAAVDLSIVQDGGANGGFIDAPDSGRAISASYQPLAMRFRGIPVVTNTTPRGPQRGPGFTQIAAIMEPIMDKAARELDVDRLDIRLMNAPGMDATVDGERIPVTSAYMPEALERGAALFDWETQRTRSGERTGSKVIGIGIGQSYHDIGRSGYDGLVVLTPDGRLHLHSGVGNLGTYSYVGTTRAAAEALKCDWENCVVHHGITSRHLPYATMSVSSTTSWTMSRANYVAGMDAVAKLKEIAALDLGGDPADYDIGEHRVFRIAAPDTFLTYAQAAQRAIELGGKYSGAEPPDDIHDITRTSVAGVAGTGLVGVAKDTLRLEGDAPALVCGFARVEVDVETGEVAILDYVAVADCGTVMHPQGLATQLKGGGAFGMGYALHERQIYDPQNGLPGNIGFHHCKPATYLDVPATVQWDAVDKPDPQNPTGIRGVGEPTMGAAAAAVLSAVSDALDGHIFNRVPVTADMIVNHVAGRPQSYRPLQIHSA